MKHSVFISSTFKDLIPHRERLWAVLDSYKLEIRGMEAFGARPENALDTCLQEVRRSQIYIGVLGMVYGSVDKSGKSYTQLEYEEAENNNLDIFIYHIHEKKGRIAPDNFDHKHYHELLEFKAITKKHTYDTFIDENDLAEKVHKLIKAHYPNLINGFYRNESIPARIKRFKDSNKEWIVLVGFQDAEPVELYVSNAENVFLPSWVDRGYIIRTRKKVSGKEKEWYDLAFKDKDGYRIIYEGYSRSSDRDQLQLNQVVTRLLQSGKESIDTIMDIASVIELNGIKDKQKFLEKIKSVLLLKNVLK